LATVIHFDHDLEYLDTPIGPAPALMVSLENPQRPGRFHDAMAYLDTGSQRTVFDGDIAESLGIDILRGEKVKFTFNHLGGSIGAREHRVALAHHLSFGKLDVTVCFSEEPIRRNLLGRDFLRLLQVGFRQYDQMFFLSLRR
jgi:hypothetical protein